MIFDIEADGLLDDATKIHVMAWKEGERIRHTHNYDTMRGVLTNRPTLIGHSIITYDIPLVEKILDIRINARLVDTLALSWYVNHQRVFHGLESYGEDFGVFKPQIDDWVNLSDQQYAHRCKEDVKINSFLYESLTNKLSALYSNEEDMWRLIDYLSFKMQCARLQEESRIKADVNSINKHFVELSDLIEEKTDELTKVMPKVKKYVKKSRPEKPFKKDGTWSVIGAKWFNLLKKHNLPEDYTGEVSVLHHIDEANPMSHAQVKDWLFSMGWKPRSFNFVKTDNGPDRKIPLVRVGSGLCPSVLELTERRPEVKLLEGLAVLQHRHGIFKGFRKSLSEDGYLTARVAGFTNTLRFRHKKPLVNLPKVGVEWGEEIRGSLIADDGEVLCGADMVSLEDTTKRHFMKPFDPEYVKEMSKPGYDPHLSLAVYAKALTEQDVSNYQEGKGDVDKVKRLRQIYKVVNYAATYGIGAAKLARDMKLSVNEAKKVIDDYWKKNWAIKAACDKIEKKTFNGGEWILNPVSKFWYSLRNEKDVFSTLNQGTATYAFDTWLKYTIEQRRKLAFQMHDEQMQRLKEGYEQQCTRMLRTAIDRTNEELKLNVTLDIDIKYGKNYAEVH